MSTVVNKGWLKDNNGDKFAPKTLLSQVVDRDGESLETYIDSAVYADVEDNVNVEDVEENNTDIIVDDFLSETSVNPVQNKIVTEKVNQLQQEIEDLKENEGGATAEQIKQIETNRQNIENLSQEIEEVRYIEHIAPKKYSLDISNVKLPSSTVGGATNNLCLIATRSIQSDDKMPDCTGYLYCDKATSKFYYSSVTPDNPVYLFDWDSSLANGEEPLLWMASITADGDIVFLKYRERRNPIIYPNNNYGNPYVVDFGESKAPFGYLMASSIVQFDDGSFVFGDYAFHALKDEEENDPRNIWRVVKPYENVSSWTVSHAFKHVHFSSEQSDEPDNEIGHIHAISYDWYSGVTYCNTGDIDRHCRIWKSLDKGITWNAIDGAVGTDKKPNVYGDGQKWRTASFVFTKDYCYWGTDSFYEQHILYRCHRDESGEVDFNTLEEVCSLEQNPLIVGTQATYGHILLRNPNGILILDRAEPRPDGLLDVTFYSFDDEKLYICETLERATTDIGGPAYEVENRIGLPNQCGTYYQPQCIDYAMIGGAYIRANNTSLFYNSVSNYVGALKLKVNEIGIVSVAHPSQLKIVKQPTNAVGSVGDTVIFNIEATGDELTYQWYTMTSDGKWWGTSIYGSTTNTLTVELNASRITYLYKCIVTDKYGNSVESNIVKVTSTPDHPDTDSLAITNQPIYATGEIGDTVTFSVEATGDGLTYQWYANVVGGDGSAAWYKATYTGNNTNTLSVELTEARMQNLYKCIVTDSNGNSLESNVVGVTIPLEINKQPVNAEGKIGETITFNVVANGLRPAYLWHTSTDNGLNWSETGMTGSKTSTLTVNLNESRIKYLYKCIITDYLGNNVESNIVKVVEVPSEPGTETLSIVKQPTNANGNIGDTVTFNIEATGTGLTYQWYANVPSDNNNNIYTQYNWYNTTLAGYNTDTLTVELTEEKMQYMYKCVVTDYEGNSVESNAVFVPTQLEIAQQPSDTHGEIGDTVKFNVKVNGFRTSYQWQTSTDGGIQWYNTGITGDKTNTLTVELNASRITYLYRCVITDYFGDTIATNAAKII